MFNFAYRLAIAAALRKNHGIEARRAAAISKAPSKEVIRWHRNERWYGPEDVAAILLKEDTADRMRIYLEKVAHELQAQCKVSEKLSLNMMAVFAGAAPALHGTRT